MRLCAHFFHSSGGKREKRMNMKKGGEDLRVDTTTYSTERSEHFKPCRDKDLAYCLNDGECFVIETLTGSHKHCRH
ncbi:pro-neuregulin-3, membrane-bound isoform [Cricetulus griseus]|nr:pro-neuregulin-3, membrane-bound isoform [Cricetulus griseus]